MFRRIMQYPQGGLLSLAQLCLLSIICWLEQYFPLRYIIKVKFYDTNKNQILL